MSPYNVGGVRASNAPTSQQSNVFSGGALEPGLFRVQPANALAQLTAGAPVREMEWLRFDGQPFYLCWADPMTSWLIPADASGPLRMHFDSTMLLAKAQQAVPDGKLTESTLLTDYDMYYLAIGSVASRRLPMLRVKFDDAAQTWLYVDPHTGGIVRRYDSYGRGWRFVMNGLHTWDFLRYRPLWDMFMLLMCAGGAFLSVSAIALSLYRLGLRKTAPPWKTK